MLENLYMPLIEWSDEYSVNIAEIDAQHKKIVALINKMHDGLKWMQGREAAGRVLSQLVEYTIYHFNYEEKLIEQNNYPDTAAHKKEHALLIKEVTRLQAEFDNNKGGNQLEILLFLKTWLTSHIQQTDKLYSPHLKSLGVN